MFVIIGSLLGVVLGVCVTALAIRGAFGVTAAALACMIADVE